MNKQTPPPSNKFPLSFSVESPSFFLDIFLSSLPAYKGSYLSQEDFFFFCHHEKTRSAFRIKFLYKMRTFKYKFCNSFLGICTNQNPFHLFFFSEGKNAQKPRRFGEKATFLNLHYDSFMQYFKGAKNNKLLKIERQFLYEKIILTSVFKTSQYFTG